MTIVNLETEIKRRREFVRDSSKPWEVRKKVLSDIIELKIWYDILKIKAMANVS